jgi:hypothetical protein
MNGFQSGKTDKLIIAIKRFKIPCMDDKIAILDHGNKFFRKAGNKRFSFLDVSI